MSMTRLALRLVALFAVLPAAGSCQRLDVESSDASSDPTDPGDTTLGDETSNDDDDDDDDDSNDDDAESEAGESGGPVFECDPVEQTGCNGDDKCTVVLQAGSYGYTCVADTVAHASLESCDPDLAGGLDGCPAGTACLSDEAEQGLCIPLCIDGSDCGDGNCIPDLENDIPYCADECSPFEAMCPTPLQCRRLDDRFGCSFVRPDDTGSQGEPCSVSGDVGCAEGFACMPGGLVPGCASDNCCSVLCDTTLGGCDSPSTCTTLFDSPSPGSESIGVCIVPS
jgi:hypothetical protein